VRKDVIPTAIEIALETSEKTIAFGKQLATKLPPNSVLALFGELGAGKTTFVQGLALGLQIISPIQSPTFNYLNIYQGTLPLHHFDLYRLRNSSDFLALGFEEYFEKEGITVMEWSERILPLLPIKTLSITFSYKNQGRIATIASPFDLNLIESCSSWD